MATQHSAEGRQAVPEVALEAPHVQALLDRRHPGGARPRRVHELDHEPEHKDEDRGGSPGELLDVEGIGAHPIENFRVRQRVGEEREDHGEGASEVDEMQSPQIQPHDIPILHFVPLADVNKFSYAGPPASRPTSAKTLPPWR